MWASSPSFRRLAGVAPPKLGPDPCHQDARLERFDDEVVCAELKTGHINLTGQLDAHSAHSTFKRIKPWADEW